MGLDVNSTAVVTHEAVSSRADYKSYHLIHPSSDDPSVSRDGSLKMTTIDYQSHRAQLLREMEVGDLAVVPAGDLTTRNNDVHYRFRQDSDFRHLTGFCEPGALAVLVKEESGSDRFLLFVPPKDPTREVWDGPRAGVEGALADFGADEAFELSAIDEKLPKLLENRRRVLYPLGAPIGKRIEKWRLQLGRRVRLGVEAPSLYVDLRSLLHEQRVRKETGELQAMRRAAQISAEAHRKAMIEGRPGSTENHLEGVIEGYFRSAGAERIAYGSIVAAGANGCVLHYINNNSVISDGEMLLVDAGAEVDGYAADITTTWPANGRFGEAQRRLYSAVLEVQQDLVRRVRPGSSFRELNQEAVQQLTAAMQDLGLLDGDSSVDDLVEAEAYKPYYMHSIGHWLGRDVHDVGGYGTERGRPFEPGMVLTIEPGIYVPADDETAPPALRGLAVRIEDDVLVTADEPENLTADLPRTAEAIEQFIGQGRT